MDPVFQNLYLPNAAKAPELKPTFARTLKSAFGLENDVVNLLDYVSRPVFPPDNAFDFKKEFETQKVPVEWMPLLSSSTSKPEFDFTLGKIQKEYKDKAVLASSGWAGTVAALSAGVLSPTAFIPFAGQARGGMAFAEVLALAAAGAGAQNGALFLNQATRTEAELYSGIAMDTLLMGLLGGAWIGLSKEGRARLSSDLSYNDGRFTVPEGPMDGPPAGERIVRTEAPSIAGVKQEVQRENIRNPEDVRALEAEANPTEEYVPLRERALAIGEVKRVRAKTSEDELAYGKNFLEVPIASGVTARFTKVPAGSGGKWFTDNEYAVTLHREDGAEITISRDKVDSHTLAGATGVYKEAELKQAIAEGRLDDQFYKLLENADDTGMAAPRGEPTIPDAARATDNTSAAGAQVTRTRNTLGPMAAPNKVRQAAMDILGKLSPSYRMLSQRMFPSIRDAIAKVDLSGIRQAGLEAIEPSADSGVVIERIRGYDPYLVEFALAIDKNYYRYIHGTDQGFDFNSPGITQLKAQFGRLPGGKLNWPQYKEAVFDALNTADVPADIAPSVQIFKEFFEKYTVRQEQYLQEMLAQGLDVKPLFKVISGKDLGKGVEEYAHHIFSKQKLMDNFSQFLEDFGNYNENRLQESFKKAKVKHVRKQALRQFERDVASLDEKAISQRLAEVEGSVEFFDEIPEWQTYKASRAAIMKQAKDEGWSKEQLKEQLKDLEDNLTPDIKQMQVERKGLMAQARSLRKFGGDAAEKTAKLKADIDKLDESIDAMFRQELPGIARADLAIGKVQKEGDKAFATVSAGLKRTLAALQKRQLGMSKLLNSSRANTITRQKAFEQLEATKKRYEDMLYRLDTINGQQIARDQALSELSLLREDVVQEATRVVRNRAARLQDLEDRLEAAGERKVLTPEERLRMRDQVTHEMEVADGDFQQLWSSRGEASGDPLNTASPDFKDKSREMATQLHQKLMNTEVELSPAYYAMRQDARGAELLRVMKVPYAIKSKYLEKDVEVVSRAYDRVMAPDLELWRAFEGDVRGVSALGQMQDEATARLLQIQNAKYVKLPKGWTDNAKSLADRVKKRLTDLGSADDVYLEDRNFSAEPKAGYIELTQELRDQLSQSVYDAVKATKNDWDVAIQRLRATRGVPQDSGSILWRTGSAVKKLNVTTMMGGVLPASISDVARPINRHGLAKVYKHGWAPFINRLVPDYKRFRVRSKKINMQTGLNLEPFLHGRFQSIFDLGAESIDRTRLERGITFAANKMGLIAMYDFWTAGMKSIAGNVFHATMVSYVPEVAKAMREGAAFEGDLLQMRTYLRNLGLSDITIQRIGSQMEKPNGVEYFSNGGVLPNLEGWDDAVAYQAYQAAGLKEVNELIVTPGLERPNIVDENLAYSMLFQFKSFTFASNSRVVMSNLQGNDPYLMQGLTFALAFGALSYYTYAIAAGGKTLEKANKMEADKFLWEAAKRSGILGALSLGTDVAGSIPALSGQDPTFFTKPSGLLGALLGPTYGQANRIAGVITQLGSEDPKQMERNLKAVRQVFIPFQNHFLWRRFLDRAGEAMTGG